MKSKFSKFLLSYILIALGTAGVAMAADLEPKDHPGSVLVQQALVQQTNGALLLDVRETDEYAAVHAPGSTLIPLGQLAQRLQELGNDKARPIVVVCRSGRRSAEAQKILERAGFSAVQNVTGGMLAWQKAGLPVAPRE